MIRRQIFLTPEQDKYLKELGDFSVSEHIRRAVDTYIAQRVKEQAVLISSSSPSKNTHVSN